MSLIRILVLIEALFWTIQASPDYSNISKCGLYLAPSSIPGAGLGMYAGQDINAGGQVTYGDIVIPMIEIMWHNGREDFFWLWDEYTWSSSIVPEMDEETESTDLEAASPGIGAALNCVLPLVNIESSDVKCDNGGLSRGKDPGNGAITPYYDRRAYATADLRAGDELFINYGENYFETRTSTYGQMPMHADYKKADFLLRRYVRLRNNALTGVSDNLLHGLWDVITKSVESRTLNALPKDHDRIDEVLRIGTAMQHKERSRRTIEWLEEHGQCMDNIRDGLSTVPQAGRGAFATRFIPKGGLVAPAPLIHIPNRSHVIMYGTLPMDENGHVARNVSSPVHKQLLLNYCFGHPESSMLLSPYGALVNLINHASTGFEANARIQWSKTMRHSDWKELDPFKLEDEWHSGLSFDFVALRDIEPDEEILIDYGERWQTAWDEFIDRWTPPPQSGGYRPGYELNQDLDLVMKTYQDGPYLPHLKLWIHNAYRLMQRLEEENIDHYQVVVLDKFRDPTTDEWRYTAETFTTSEEEDRTRIYPDAILWSIPRDAFIFDDIAYTRDHHMTWTFRHEIDIPDEMFPEAWRNLREKAEGEVERTEL